MGGGGRGGVAKGELSSPLLFLPSTLTTVPHFFLESSSLAMSNSMSNSAYDRVGELWKVHTYVLGTEKAREGGVPKRWS